MATTRQRPSYCAETGEFRFPLGGPGNPVLVGKDLSKLEDELDRLERIGVLKHEQVKAEQCQNVEKQRPVGLREEAEAEQVGSCQKDQQNQKQSKENRRS